MIFMVSSGKILYNIHKNSMEMVMCMGKFLIVSYGDRLQEYIKVAKKYSLGLEWNDFYQPDLLDSPKMLAQVERYYTSIDLPEFNTMHGAFYDVTVFSSDSKIRSISISRMEQSLFIARRLGAKSVVFHTNVNPFLTDTGYLNEAVEQTVQVVQRLLSQYPEINIYLENMFEQNPTILAGISEQLGHLPNYGVCFDYAHASISSTPVEGWLEKLHPYIKHVHVNDNDGIHDLHLAVGEGVTDWNLFAKYYHNYFEKCSVLIETADPLSQQRSLEYLRKIEVFS
jgi:sugar phosphate isomerase/epimerase